MKQWAIGEVARRLRRQIAETDSHVVWFLGAGCSISSGIPGAGQLVQQWMEDLRELKLEGFDAWAEESCPDWQANPAYHYGTVIDERFGGNPKARQDEIARLVRDKEPGFGYACLAQLMTHPEYGHRNNLVLTTNFDDLIADAMYLYTRQKPLTMVHEALAAFMRASETTPLVVKVHGDSQLAPKNTPRETSDLGEHLTNALRRILRDAVVVFLGYGGNDVSIAKFLAGCTRNEIAGAYWVGEALPGNDMMRTWLQNLEGGVHVRHQDFDAFMAELYAEFSLGAPDFDRFSQLRESYKATAERLTGASARGSESAAKAVSALEAWQLNDQAISLGFRDLQQREQMHRQSIEAQPNDAGLMSNFGCFLMECDRDREAQEVFERALTARPDDPAIVGNLAMVRAKLGDDDEAELLFEKSLAAGLTLENQNNISAYAYFLGTIGKLDRAEELFMQATAIWPDHNASIGRYALFLTKNGRSGDALKVYERALDAQTFDVNILANYAGLLIAEGCHDRSREMVEKARKLATESAYPNSVLLELDLYSIILGIDAERAKSELSTLLERGERSRSWDFEPMITQAPETVSKDWLRAVAGVINGTETLSTLDDFSEWTE